MPILLKVEVHPTASSLKHIATCMPHQENKPKKSSSRIWGCDDSYFILSNKLMTSRFKLADLTLCILSYLKIKTVYHLESSLNSIHVLKISLIEIIKDFAFQMVTYM